jgi:hypothetical protein
MHNLIIVTFFQIKNEKEKKKPAASVGGVKEAASFQCETEGKSLLMWGPYMWDPGGWEVLRCAAHLTLDGPRVHLEMWAVSGFF